MSPFTVGLCLHGRFTLVARIGQGGMSEVWRAVDEVLGRPVAVKVLSAPLATDPGLRSATWREARAAARIAHPNVTPVYDYGEAPLPGGVLVPYLVMELVEGECLAARLAAGPLPWPEAVRVVAEVAAALAAAHRLGVVHRDVKPGNVMVTPTGARVLDFGIAALTVAQVGKAGPVQVGKAGPVQDAGDGSGDRLVGTPEYAAPEQVRGAAPQPASDVYALGALLHETLTGRPPFPAQSWDQAAAVHRAGVPVPVPEVPGLPPAVARLCRRCLAADPAGRPEAREVAAELAAIAGRPDPAEAPPRGAGREAGPGAGRATGSGAGRATGSGAGREVGPGTRRSGRFVGLAPRPHPPTRIAPAGADADGGASAEGQRGAAAGSGRLLVVGLAGAVVAFALALVVAVAALLSGGAGRAGPVAAPTALPSAAPSSAPSSQTTPITSTPSTAPSPPLSPTAILVEMDRVIERAVDDGRLDEDAADRLRDRLDPLWERRSPNKLRRAADEFQEKLDDLYDDGELDDETAGRLAALLARFVREAVGTS